MASVSGSDVSDGPVLSLITKKLRALKKKLNRISQLEEIQSQGKTLIKEQLDLLNSKSSVSLLIDEYEKLRLPLSSALQEELSRTKEDQNPKEDLVEDLIKIVYFGCLFDVKSQSEFTLMARMHERHCCLTYDYVTDDDAATDMLGERDLDMISALGELLTSRPVCSEETHKSALEACIERAKLWIQKSPQPISPGVDATYAGVREKLNKIMALDFFTMTPQMKAPVDVAAVVGKYNSGPCQVQGTEEESGVPVMQDEHQVDAASAVHYQQKEDEQEELQAVEVSNDQPAPNETENVDESNAQIPSGDQQRVEADPEHNQVEYEQKDQHQYIQRRPYQGQRGGRGDGRGRRGYYSNGRGGRGSRGGSVGGYQNGRGQQHYDSGYHPRNNYNNRGRGGGRYGSNNYGGAATHGGPVEVHANS